VVETKDCILFATADWDAPYWTNKQHMAVQLAKAGYRVLYIESIGLRAPNLGSSRDLSRIARRLKCGLQGPRKVAENIWVLSPLVLPFKHQHPVVRAFNQGWLSRAIRRLTHQQQFMQPLVWTYHPFMLETVARLQHGKIVYHCVDDLSVVPGINLKAFNAEEQRLLKQVQIVFTTSPALAEKCARCNSNTHYLPNVVDAEQFARARQLGPLPDDLVDIPEPRIVYCGALSDYKVDFKLIYDVALQRPDWHWVLIGDEREGQQNQLVATLHSMTNVHFIGHKPYALLPEYLRCMAIGTLPSLINDYTRSMFPMKYYEYLAAGLPVVATPLEFTKTCQNGLLVAETKTGFIQALEQQLLRGRLTDQEADAFVADNTWGARLDKMLVLLNNVTQIKC